MKKVSKKFIVIISIVLVCAISVSGYFIYDNFSGQPDKGELKTKITKLCQAVYDTYGEDMSDDFKGFISKYYYKRLNYRADDEEIVKEENDAGLSKIVIDGNKATAYYNYAYSAYDKNDEIVTGMGVWYEPIEQIIHLKKINNNWKVDYVEEELF
ncbi:MAG: hypothetical protein ACI4HM_04885 [Ruminococcus sp.]